MHLVRAMSAKDAVILPVAVNLRQKSLSQKLRFSKIKEMVSAHWVGTIFSYFSYFSGLRLLEGECPFALAYPLGYASFKRQQPLELVRKR